MKRIPRAPSRTSRHTPRDPAGPSGTNSRQRAVEHYGTVREPHRSMSPAGLAQLARRGQSRPAAVRSTAPGLRNHGPTRRAFDLALPTDSQRTRRDGRTAPLDKLSPARYHLLRRGSSKNMQARHGLDPVGIRFRCPSRPDRPCWPALPRKLEPEHMPGKVQGEGIMPMCCEIMLRLTSFKLADLRLRETKPKPEGFLVQCLTE